MKILLAGTGYIEAARMVEEIKNGSGEIIEE